MPTAQPTRCPAGYGSPLDIDSEHRVPIHTAEFAADPHRAYAQMREQYGSLVPVELSPGVPATLVIGYRTALRILHDPEHFPADPSIWQRDIPPSCPVLPMMMQRDNSIRSAGTKHARYRLANVEAIDQVDLHGTHAVVERIALEHINRFCGTGEADLIRNYAFPLVFDTMSILLGCDPDVSTQASAGMAMIFDTVDAAEGNRLLVEALAELARRKRARPGNDITSWLIAHPAGLTEDEIVQQLVTLHGATSEPLTNLIVNTLLLMMTRNDFGGNLAGGALSTRDALDEVLFHDPPMANFSTSYPRQPQLIDNVWLPAHQPVVISLAACNNDPAIAGGDISGNRSHLAFSAGPHKCPAQDLGRLIATDAIDQFLDAIPDIRLAVAAELLRWRPGAFHRALEALPVVFDPVSPLTVPTPAPLLPTPR